ncbi:hypothetical protein ADK67_47800 [Saccharothrix sp. NRRL B-16348]|nr:hypothetical protein ADK67_47800 [Saccharothrix sp. NRRL B-16348]
MTVGLMAGGAGIATAAEAVAAPNRSVAVVQSAPVAAEVTLVPAGATTSGVQLATGVPVDDGTVRPAGIGRWIVDALIAIGRWVYDQAVAAVRAGWNAFITWWNNLPGWVRFLIPVGAEEVFRAVGCHVLNQTWLC